MRYGIAALVVAGLGIGGYVLYGQVSQPPKRKPPSNSGFQNGLNTRQLPLGGGNNGVVPIARELRIFANASVMAEGYVISVRQVMLGGIDRSLFDPRSSPAPGAENLMLHLQVAKPGETQIAGCRIDPDSFEATDSTGKKLTHLRLTEELATPQPIPGGLVQAVRLSLSAPEANCLKELTGKLLVDSTGKIRRTIPIRFENVPLPSAPRLFADLKPLVSDAAGRPDGLSQISSSFGPVFGEAASSVTRNAKTPETGLPLPRLVAAVGVPARVPLPTVDSTDGFTMTLDAITPLGYRVTLRSGSATWSGTLWPGEPFLIALPASSANRQLCEMTVWPAWRMPARSETPSPFPAPRARPGGAVSWKVLAGGRPFGAGTLALQVSRMEGARWSAPVPVAASIGFDGSVAIRGMAPGRYRIERLTESLVPDPLVEGQAPSLPDYLRERFGHTAGDWENRIVEMDVRAGMRIEAPDLKLSVLGTASGAASSSANQSSGTPAKSR